MPSLINNSYHALMNWCYRFLKLIGYSIRKVTHIGQELKENSKDLTFKFFTCIYSNRKELYIFDN